MISVTELRIRYIFIMLPLSALFVCLDLATAWTAASPSPAVKSFPFLDTAMRVVILTAKDANAEHEITIKANNVNDSKNRITELLKKDGCVMETKVLHISWAGFTNGSQQIHCTIGNDRLAALLRDIKLGGGIERYDVKNLLDRKEYDNIRDLYNKVNNEMQANDTVLRSKPAIREFLSDLLTRYSERIRRYEWNEKHTFITVFIHDGSQIPGNSSQRSIFPRAPKPGFKNVQ